MTASRIEQRPTPFHMWTHGVTEQPATGCSVHALESVDLAAAPASGACAQWGAGFKTRSLSGTYEQVAELWGEASRGAKAAVLIFTRGDGMESFLTGIGPQLAGLPVAGGAAARASGRRGEIAPGPEGDVLAWFIDQGNWISETVNVHEAQELRCEFKAQGPRRIVELKPATGDWEPATAAFARLQAQFGVKDTDFESVTFSDLAGRNLHCSRSGRELHCGSDLPTKEPVLVVRRTDPLRAQASLQRFASEPGSLVFACAGLYGLLKERLKPAPGTLAGFMFGEVVTNPNHEVVFANLMASRLRPNP